MKIAIVEDDEIQSRSLAKELGDNGFTVLQAFDGAEGLKLVERERPDLILLDILMPKMDGMEFLKRLRESSGGNDIPVIFLTVVKPDDDIIRKVAAYHPAFYLMKPDWRLEDIAAKVKEVLKIDGERT